MATGIRAHNAGFAFSGDMVQPQEVDTYFTVHYTNPDISNGWVGAGTASGPAATATFTYGTASKKMDYPRNLRNLWTTGSGTPCGGTVTVVGKDQFGSSVTETIVKVGTTAATVEGTVVFAQITSFTAQQWTSATDVGTIQVGGAILGTTAKLGLPFKIAGTTDIANIAWASNGTQVVNNKGSLGAFIDTTYHAIKALKTFEGTMGVSVWAHPTYDSTNDVGNNAGLSQI